MKNSFLPTDYKQPVMGGGYMKLEDGENMFRVLSSAIVGFEYWTTENKPIKSKTLFKETPNIRTEKDGSKSKVKHFWAFVVWNYKSETVEILQVTQSSIQTSINNLVMDEDWGDPKEYDIKITRKGSGLETEYSTNPKPKKPLTDEQKNAFIDKTINLEALYTGSNPFEETSSDIEISNDDLNDVDM